MAPRRAATEPIETALPLIADNISTLLKTLGFRLGSWRRVRAGGMKIK